MVEGGGGGGGGFGNAFWDQAQKVILIIAVNQEKEVLLRTVTHFEHHLLELQFLPGTHGMICTIFQYHPHLITLLRRDISVLHLWGMKQCVNATNCYCSCTCKVTFLDTIVSNFDIESLKGWIGFALPSKAVLSFSSSLNACQTLSFIGKLTLSVSQAYGYVKILEKPVNIMHSNFL